MSFASKYNNDKKFTLDTKDFEYFDLKDLYDNDGEDHVYPFLGFYINKKTNYDPYPVCFTDSFFVNLPSHMTAICQEILQDEEGIEDINAGKVGFTIRTYYSEKHKKDCYSIRFIDVVPVEKKETAKK